MGYKVKRIMVGDKQVRPDKMPGYQEVEYIQSSGTQYIDTLYSLGSKSNFSMEFKFTGTITSDFQVLGGVRMGTGNEGHCSIGYRSSDGVWYIYGGTGILSPSGLDFSTPTILKVDFNKGYLNGVEKVSLTNNVWSGAESNLYIFARNYNGFNAPASVNMYNVKFFEGEDLVRDFVPCYRKSDSVIGLYDLVNNQFYTNSGSGTFTKGPNVN